MKKALLFVFLFIILLTPSLVFAGGVFEGQLVPTTCGGVGQMLCQFCHLVELVDNVLNFAIAFTVVVATLMFAYAGILYVTAAASPKNIQKAHSVFGHVFVGFILVLAAWMVINIVLSVLTGNGLAFWTNEIDCVAQPTASAPGAPVSPGLSTITPGPLTPGPIIPLPSGPMTGGACAGIFCVGLPLNTSSASCLKADDGVHCLVTQPTAMAVGDMAEELASMGAGTVTVTAAIGGTHVAQCQNAGNAKSGTCIDMVLSGPTVPTANTVASVVDVARANGLRAEFEVPTQQMADFIRAQPGGSSLGPRDVLVVSAITGPHFSVYLASANPAPRF